ncbi:type III-A CRISPR-associated RAMP protein Csm5 [Spirochaetia bacterium 38H-sp]|uniref:CRISPR system Cms protein Csm5 n=1 Tax=Rarispira pelagica TaxID=3141764 RepID=A0ABU9U8L7_9SPIR
MKKYKLKKQYNTDINKIPDVTKKYKFELMPLTAIHIGNGESISPFQYTVARKNGQREVLIFYPEKLIHSLSKEDLSEYYKYTDKNDIKELRAFLSKKVTAKFESCKKYTAKPSNEFVEKYKQTKTDINNILEIAEIYKNNNRLVVPGSSIKGAIRTAVLNNIADSCQEHNINNNREEVEKKILGYHSAKDDPFRLISIEDVSYPIENNLIVSPLKLVHYDASINTRRINIYAEALKGLLIDSIPTISSGEIIIHNELANKKVENKMDFILKNEKYYNIEKLAEYINNFFYKVFEKEYKKIRQSYHDDNIKKTYDQIAEYIKETKDKGEILLRLGRWSHIEAMTIEKVRRKKHSKTRTLMEYNGQLYPMGWCTMKIYK